MTETGFGNAVVKAINDSTYVVLLDDGKTVDATVAGRGPKVGQRVQVTEKPDGTYEIIGFRH